MQTAMKGNLGDVRKALRDVSVGDVVDYVDPCDPLSAEIVPNATPRWHVLETRSNHERVVGAHLVARRFGMYVPETEEDIVRRGRKLHVTRLMFTGYVFVFVWDIMAHMSRLETIPGVARVLCHPPTPDGHPATPVIIPDKAIDIVRVEENKKRPLRAVVDDEVIGKKRGRKRRRVKTWEDRLRAEQEEAANDIIDIRSWDAFRDAISTLDAGGRNQSLLRALGLSS
jgi:transcriptional antiterminator NusG